MCPTENYSVAETASSPKGGLVVRRLLEAGHRVESVLVNVASYRALEASLSRLPEDVPVFICDTDEFTSLTGFNLHRGCIAMAERPMDRSLDDVARQADLLLVLEGITDPDNVGSAFRNAAAFGASVVLSEACCDPLYRKAIRTSMGSVLRTPYARMPDWPRDLAALKSEGFTVVALTPRENAIDLSAYARRRPQRTALLVGSEGPGLTAAARGDGRCLRAHPDQRRCRFAEPRNRHRHRTLLLHQSPTLIPNP